MLPTSTFSHHTPVFGFHSCTMNDADITTTPMSFHFPHLPTSHAGNATGSPQGMGSSPVSSDMTLADACRSDDESLHEDKESLTPTLTRSSTLVASVSPPDVKQGGPWFQSAFTGSTYNLGSVGCWSSTPSTPRADQMPSHAWARRSRTSNSLPPP